MYGNHVTGWLREIALLADRYDRGARSLDALVSGVLGIVVERVAGLERSRQQCVIRDKWEVERAKREEDSLARWAVVAELIRSIQRQLPI